MGSFLLHQGLYDWAAAGITPEITWQPPANITFADINNGVYDAYFATSAAAFKQFGSTLFVRPFHEFNGGWYPWGLQNQGASADTDTAFISAWQRMVSIFRAQGATNVKFVWCFSAGVLNNAIRNTWDNPANAYPGDAYVDWISFDSYNRGSAASGARWHSFDQTIGQAYQLAVSISPNKPISISEIASNEYGDGGAAKTTWVTGMLDELQSSSNPYPHLRLFSWFESDIKGYTYDLQSTSPVFTAFANGIRGTDASGHAYFRGNASALAQVFSP